MSSKNASQLESSEPAHWQPAQSPPRDKFIILAAKIEVALLRQCLIVGILGVFIMFGLFLANYSINWADRYWSAMFPLFGLVCLGHQLIAGDPRGKTAWQVP